MNIVAKILVIAIGMFLLDLPWLYIQGAWVLDFVRDIQAGRSMNIRPWAGIPVYLALGYLVTQQISAPRAFLAGLCVYAVYDFTVLAVFKDYPYYLAGLDTLWGGTLFSAIYYLRQRLGF